MLRNNQTLTKSSKMIHLLTSIKGPHDLQDIALAHVADNAVRKASMLNSRLNQNIYLYHFPGNREIKGRNYADFGKEKIYYLTTNDDRIAVNDATCLSAILSKDQALKWFRYFHDQINLSIYKDRTGIYYVEEKLVPYYYTKDNLHNLGLGDTSFWCHYDWKRFFSMSNLYDKPKPGIPYKDPYISLYRSNDESYDN